MDHTRCTSLQGHNALSKLAACACPYTRAHLCVRVCARMCLCEQECVCACVCMCAPGRTQAGPETQPCSRTHARARRQGGACLCWSATSANRTALWASCFNQAAI